MKTPSTGKPTGTAALTLWPVSYTHLKGITIEGGEVTAQGDLGGAGIGGGISGTGSDVTISGDAQVKVQGGRANEDWHKGAAIGNGGTRTADGNEVSPNTSRCV